MNLSNISQSLSNVPDNERRTLNLSPVENEEWQKIVNLRVEYDGDYSYWKTRSGYDRTRTIAGSAITTEPISIRKNGVLKHYLAIHTSVGALLLHEQGTVQGTSASGDLRFQLNAQDTLDIDFIFTIENGSEVTVNLAGQYSSQSVLEDDLRNAFSANQILSSLYVISSGSDTISFNAREFGTSSNASVDVVINTGSLSINNSFFIDGGTDGQSMNQIVSAGTLSTDKQVFIKAIGGFIYVFDDGKGWYYDPDTDITSQWGPEIPLPVYLHSDHDGTGSGSTPLVTTNDIYVKAFSVAYLYNDGTVSYPGAPLYFTNVQSDGTGGYEGESITGITLEIPTPPPNVVGRYILATNWGIADSGYPAPSDPGYPGNIKDDIIFNATPDEILTPSTTNLPNGFWFIVDQIGTDTTKYTYETLDSNLKDEFNSLVDMDAGVTNMLSRGDVEPRCMGSIENTMLLGGYTINRIQPKYFAPSDTDEYKKGKNIRFWLYYPLSGVEWSAYSLGSMFEYTDGSFSNWYGNDYGYNEIEGTFLIPVGEYNPISIHALNSQVRKVHIGVTERGYQHLKFGGFANLASSQGIGFVSGSGRVDGGATYHEISFRVDGGDIETRELATNTLTSLGDLVTLIDMLLNLYGATAYYAGDEIRFSSKKQPEKEAKFELLIQEGSNTDLFYNLLVAPSGNTVSYTGTSIVDYDPKAYVHKTISIEDPEAHGKPFVLKFPVSPDSNFMYEINLVDHKGVGSIDLGEYIATVIPQQNFLLTKQTSIADKSPVTGIVPTSIDTERDTIRKTMTVFTSNNVQYGYVIDNANFYEGEFEIIGNTSVCKNPASARFIDQVVYFDSNYGIEVAVRNAVNLLIDSDRYKAAQSPLRGVAYNDGYKEIYFAFDNQEEVLIYDIPAQGLRRFSFSPSVGQAKSICNLNGEEYYFSGGEFGKINTGKTNDDGSAITGVAETRYLSGYPDGLNINEITLFGENGDVRIEVDGQQARRYGASVPWSKSFDAEYISNFLTLSMKGSACYPDLITISPRIRLEIRSSVAGGILPTAERLYMIYTPTKNTDSARSQ